MDLSEFRKKREIREFKLAAARDRDTNPQTLAELIYDDDFDVQLAVASNPSTSVQILQQFAESGNRSWWIAHSNPKFEYSNYQVFLPTDEKPSLARSKAASGELLTFLAFDAMPLSDVTEIYLRENPNLPDDVASALGFSRKKRRHRDKGATEKAPILEDYEHFSKIVDAILPYPISDTPVSLPLFSCVEEKQEKDRARIQDLKLSPYSLSLLSRSSSHVTRRRIACNIRTPQNTLIYLALRDKSEEVSYVAGNPSSPSLLLDLLSHKEFLNLIGANERIADDVFEALAANVKTPPPRLLSLACNNLSEVRAKVAENPRVPFEALCMLTFDAERDVRKACWKNQLFTKQLANLAFKYDGVEVLNHVGPDIRAFILRGLDGQSVDAMDIHEQITLAKFRETPGWILSKFASSSDHKVRREAALNAATPQTALETLAFDQENCVRYGLLFNKSTSASILDQLRWKDVISNAWQAAWHPNASSEMRWKLARENDPNIRSYVARSSYTPNEILEFLACDEVEFVRLSVYDNLNTSKETCSKIINETDRLMKHCMEASKEEAICSQIAKQAARQEISTPSLSQMLNSDHHSVRCALATNRGLDDSLYRQLADDDDEFVRFCVAKNPMISQETMEHLATDESKFVRMALTQNSEASESILMSLLNDKEPEVRQLAYSNPTSPIKEMNDEFEALSSVLSDMKESGQNSASLILGYLQKNSSKAALSSHPNTV